MEVFAFLTEFEAVDWIICHLKLTFAGDQRDQKVYGQIRRVSSLFSKYQPGKR